MATAPVPPAAAGAPSVGTAPSTIVAPWSATGLTSLGLSYGGQGYDPATTPDNEKDYWAVYNGHVMTNMEAQSAYQEDVAKYEAATASANKPQEPGTLAQFQKVTAANMAGASPDQIKASAQADYDTAQAQYKSAYDAWNAKQPGGSPDAAAPAAPVNPTMQQTITQQFSMMNSDQILNLQRRLQAAGFLGSGSYHPGTADPGTVAGFAGLLAQTNAQIPTDPSATWTSVLQDAVTKSGWQVQSNGDMTRTVAKTPSINPTAAQASLNTLIGRNASPAEIQSFIDQYNKNIAGQLDTTETLTKAGVDQTNAPAYATQSQTIQQAELESAQSNPDYATYQAATTYWNAMQQALGATGNVQNNLK